MNQPIYTVYSTGLNFTKAISNNESRQANDKHIIHTSTFPPAKKALTVPPKKAFLLAYPLIYLCIDGVKVVTDVRTH